MKKIIFGLIAIGFIIFSIILVNKNDEIIDHNKIYTESGTYNNNSIQIDLQTQNIENAEVLGVFNTSIINKEGEFISSPNDSLLTYDLKNTIEQLHVLDSYVMLNCKLPTYDEIIIKNEVQNFGEFTNEMYLEYESLYEKLESKLIEVCKLK